MLKILSESCIESKVIGSSDLHTISEQNEDLETVDIKRKSVGRKFIDIIKDKTRRKKN